MAQLVGTALSQCPNTKIIVSGYSQGAMVVHNAFSNGLTSSQVSGAVLFGDPLKRSAVGDLSTHKVKQFCGTSDTICGGGGDRGATGSHLSDSYVADLAANFAIQAAGLAQSPAKGRRNICTAESGCIIFICAYTFHCQLQTTRGLHTCE